MEAGSFLGKLRRQASQLLPTSYIRRVPFGERIRILIPKPVHFLLLLSLVVLAW